MVKLLVILGLVVVVSSQDNSVFLPQCAASDHCPADRACIGQKCEDPCVGVCGNNTSCAVRFHIPSCACLPGYTGNPFVACIPQAPPEKCSPTGRPSGRKVFRLERFTKINWLGAILHCRAHGGRLASIETREENDQIKAEISKTNLLDEHFWISGTNLIDGYWIWFSTGQNIAKHADWQPGEPNNIGGKEHCLELYYHNNNNESMWNDISCSHASYPICEYFE